MTKFAILTERGEIEVFGPYTPNVESNFTILISLNCWHNYISKKASMSMEKHFKVKLWRNSWFWPKGGNWGIWPIHPKYLLNLKKIYIYIFWVVLIILLPKRCQPSSYCQSNYKLPVKHQERVKILPKFGGQKSIMAARYNHSNQRF